MRIAFLCDEQTANGVYRSLGPMHALLQRGHEVHRLDLTRQREWGETLRRIDLLHLHRACEEKIVSLARTAKAHGAAVVWDDDDDLTRVTRDSGSYHETGGLKGMRLLTARAKLFETVDLVTTPSAVLAEGFREGGAAEVQVIENYVVDDFVTGGAPREGVQIGWVAGREHRVDLEHVPVERALQRVLEAHPRARVTTVGLQLALDHERYERLPAVPFAQLLRHVAAFDVGIAPLSPQVAISRTRSNIKLKEYAAVGVPWLASPIGPYAGLGEREGGRLVADDRWAEELEALVAGERTRRKLAKRASRWGRTQLISRNAEQWERALEDAVDRARRGAPAGAR